MESTLFMLALAVYAVATLGYLVYLISEKRVQANLARFATYIAFVFHTMAVGNTLISSQNIAGRNAISLFVWALVLVYIFIELKYSVEIFGSFVIPVVFMAIVFASVLPRNVPHILNSTKSVWKISHIVFASLGYGAFAVVFATSIMYLFQEKQLKNKQQGFVYYRLPSLDVLDKVAYNCLLFGFPFLTLAIILGIVWAGIVRHSFINWRVKEVLWVFTWVIYGVLLFARVSAGWRGRQASYTAIAAFILAYIILIL